MSKKTIYLEDAINALHTEIVKRRISEDVNDDGSLDEFDTEDILRKLPPADVQPVVRGEWIPVTAIYKFKEDQFPQTERVWVDATEPDEIDAVKCSICGEVFDFADARNWCTQCGAKMDRKGADE